jgi:hypothetical protein
VPPTSIVLLSSCIKEKPVMRLPDSFISIAVPDIVIMVLLYPAPCKVIFLESGILTPLDHVREPDGITTVSPLDAKFTAAWTADCEQLVALIVAAWPIPVIDRQPASNIPINIAFCLNIINSFRLASVASFTSKVESFNETP